MFCVDLRSVRYKCTHLILELRVLLLAVTTHNINTTAIHSSADTTLPIPETPGDRTSLSDFS